MVCKVVLGIFAEVAALAACETSTAIIATDNRLKRLDDIAALMIGSLDKMMKKLLILVIALIKMLMITIYIQIMRNIISNR